VYRCENGVIFNIW